MHGAIIFFLAVFFNFTQISAPGSRKLFQANHAGSQPTFMAGWPAGVASHERASGGCQPDGERSEEEGREARKEPSTLPKP